VRWPFSWPRRSSEDQPARDARALDAGAASALDSVARIDAVAATVAGESDSDETPPSEMRVLSGPAPVTARTTGFVAGLAGSHPLTPILWPPAHDLSPAAPGGVVHGLATTVDGAPRHREPSRPERIIARLATDASPSLDPSPTVEAPTSDRGAAASAQPGSPADVGDRATAWAPQRRLPPVAPDSVVMPREYTAVEPAAAPSAVAPHPSLPIVPLQRDMVEAKQESVATDRPRAEATPPPAPSPGPGGS